MRSSAKALATRAARALARSGVLGALERTDRSAPGLLRVLMYHRVADRDAYPALYPGLIGASGREFEEQLDWLVRRYTFIDPIRVVAAIREGRPLPPRALLVTFDDGYRDFMDVAWPALRARSIPALLFVPTAFPGDPDRCFWWDRLHHALCNTRVGRVTVGESEIDLRTSTGRRQAFAALREAIKAVDDDRAMRLVNRTCETLAVPPATGAVMGWEELRSLEREGLAIAPHTRTHPLLDRVGPDRQREEIVGSVDDLRQRLERPLPLFAYPSGAVSPTAKRALRDAGIVAAFTTQRGISAVGVDDPLELRRIPVNERTTLPLIGVQLLARAAWLTTRYP